MELFDIVKKVFSSDQEWSKVSDLDKKRNFFMINRFMSIEFPQLANQFNRINIESTKALDTWQRILSRRYRKVPGWVFTKTNKSDTKKKKDTSWDIKEDTIKFYCNRNNIRLLISLRAIEKHIRFT